MSNNSTLSLLPAFKVKLLPGNQVVITRKFIEAVLLFERLWAGPVQVVIEETLDAVEDVDKKTIDIRDLPFKLNIVSYDANNLIEYLDKTIVLASANHRQNHISKVCKLASASCIYTLEYTLKTRRQIVDVSTRNLLLRARKRMWERNQELKQRKAVALADGIQCNGVPIYEEYKSLSRDPLLFFDTRITDDLLATEEDIENRAQNWSDDAPLRLVFSGRLNQMKGADHLLDVAYELKRLGTNFELYISGSGVLEEAMHQRIQQDGLGDCVKMMGVPDFKSEFLPFVKSTIDLFVCCHRQGDPSCTYIETMSCGVPIVGYANEAFEGIVRYSNAGWLVDMNQPRLMAKKIAELSRAKDEIKQMSFASLKFARHHTFHETFQARVNHLQQLAPQHNQCSR